MNRKEEVAMETPRSPPDCLGQQADPHSYPDATPGPLLTEKAEPGAQGRGASLPGTGLGPG